MPTGEEHIQQMPSRRMLQKKGSNLGSMVEEEFVTLGLRAEVDSLPTIILLAHCPTEDK